VSPSETPFKECDIRGRYPDDLDEALFERIGAALGARIVEGCPATGGAAPSVLVGGDVRASTPRLKAALLAGLGLHPLRRIDLGLVPTPVLYWAKAAREATACAMVTASHKPPGWNGLEFMIGERPPLPDEIAALGAGGIPPAPRYGGRPMPAVESWRAARESYMGELEALFGGRGIEHLSIVLDAGNGCQAGIASRLLAKIGAEVFALHDWPDGSFPCRHPDTARPEHLMAAREAVVHRAATFGVAFDGDGDRLAVIDERGRVLAPEQLAMILLDGPLRPAPGAAVVLDLECSAKLETRVRAVGGVPRRSRSGRAHMKRMMIDEGAVLGVNMSGGFFLGRLDGRDDPLVIALLLAGALAAGRFSLAGAADSLPVMAITPDIRVPMPPEQIDAVLARCEAEAGEARVDTLDGVRLTWDDGWALVRRSITEPALTIRMEGEDGAALAGVVERIARLVGEFGSDQCRQALMAGADGRRQPAS